MSNPLERRLAAEAYLGITTEEIDRLRRERDDYKHVLEHVATCTKGTCPYCPEDARRVLARNGEQASDG